MATTYEAALSAVTAITKIGAAAIGLSLLLLLAGWHELGFYYGQLNASWVRSVYSPSMLMRAGVPSLVLLVVSSYIGFVLTVTLGLSKNAYSVISSGLIATSLIITLVINVFLSAYFLDKWFEVLLWVARVVFVAGVGMNFAVLLVRLREDELKWDEKHFILLVALLYMGLMLSPIEQVAYQAKKDISNVSALPTVKIQDEEGDWKLISAGEKMILLQKDENQKLKFRVVEPESAEWIR